MDKHSKLLTHLRRENMRVQFAMLSSCFSVGLFVSIMLLALPPLRQHLPGQGPPTMWLLLLLITLTSALFYLPLLPLRRLVHLRMRTALNQSDFIEASLLGLWRDGGAQETLGQLFEGQLEGNGAEVQSSGPQPVTALVSRAASQAAYRLRDYSSQWLVRGLRLMALSGLALILLATALIVLIGVLKFRSSPLPLQMAFPIVLGMFALAVPLIVFGSMENLFAREAVYRELLSRIEG